MKYLRYIVNWIDSFESGQQFRKWETMLNRQINQHIIEKRQITESVINVRSVWKVMKLVLTFCLVLTFLVGCGDPNLGDPKVREKISAKAIDENSLQSRSGRSGEELRYAPNQERPYSG